MMLENRAASASVTVVRELVICDLVPHIEKEMATRPQDPACLLVGQNLVRKEHRAELAEPPRPSSDLRNDRESASARRHSTCPPSGWRDAARSSIGWLRSVATMRRPVGSSRQHRPCHDTGSCGCFQHIPRLCLCQPLGEIARIGFEDQRHQKPVVRFPGRACEQLVGRHHRIAPSDAQGHFDPASNDRSLTYAAFVAAPWACLSMASIICGHIGIGSAWPMPSIIKSFAPGIEAAVSWPAAGPRRADRRCRE